MKATLLFLILAFVASLSFARAVERSSSAAEKLTTALKEGAPLDTAARGYYKKKHYYKKPYYKKDRYKKKYYKKKYYKKDYYKKDYYKDYYKKKYYKKKW